MKKRTDFLSLIMLSMLLLVISGPIFGNGKSEETNAVNTDRLQEIGFHETGYPIVDKTLNVDAWCSTGSNNTVPYDEMTLLKQLQADTNIDISFTEIPIDQLTEKVNLMFASRDYPDVLFGAGTDQNVWDAAQGSDLWPLNDLVEEYAPNWAAAMAERPVIQNALTFPDGKYYSLPYYNESLVDFGIRDTTSINAGWLEKLGLEMPTTTDELYHVLKAFRKGIDTGVLPENGIPWLLRYHAWANGGEWDIYNAFDIWMKGQGTGAERYLSVNKGKVEFGAINPNLKDAAKYLHKLYEEELILPEMFTLKSGEYNTANRTIPPYIGIYTAYFQYSNQDEWMDAMPPVTGPTGVTRYRSQPVRMQKIRFLMFKKFEYPEAMIRFMDAYGDDDYALAATYGGPDIVENSDGTKQISGNDESWCLHGPRNAFPGYLSVHLNDVAIYEGDQGLRDYNVKNVYLPYIWPQDRHYAYITYTEEETEELAILNTELGDYVKSTIADWIVNGNVDESWDEYIAKLDRLGLDKAMDIYQTAYDRFHQK